MLKLYTYQLLQKRYNLQQLIFVVFLGSPLHEFKSSNLTNFDRVIFTTETEKGRIHEITSPQKSRKTHNPQILASTKLYDSTQLQRAQTHDKRSLLMCQSTYGRLFSFLQCLSFFLFIDEITSMYFLLIISLCSVVIFFFF